MYNYHWWTYKIQILLHNWMIITLPVDDCNKASPKHTTLHWSFIACTSLHFTMIQDILVICFVALYNCFLNLYNSNISRFIAQQTNIILTFHTSLLNKQIHSIHTVHCLDLTELISCRILGVSFLSYFVLISYNTACKNVHGSCACTGYCVLYTKKHFMHRSTALTTESTS